MARVENLVLEDVRIMFRNFAGEKTRFNAAGSRNFCVALDRELADDLTNEGWNVKVLPPKDDYDDELYYLPVSLQFGAYPPNIYLVCGKRKTLLDETTVDMLDHAEIVTSDIVIRPYDWNVNGKTGRKAYVKSLYVVIESSRFEDKYRDYE